MRIMHLVAAAGLAVATLTAATPADAQRSRDGYRGDRYEQRYDRDDRGYRHGDRRWNRDRRWRNGRHYGSYRRYHRDCRRFWRHGRRVTVCYR
jgi:hypothetical protein